MRFLKISLTLGKVLKSYQRCDNMLVMDKKQVKEITGLTDDQIRYLINKVDVLKREKAQGKAREYSNDDAAVLKFAAELRHKRAGIHEINELVNLIYKNPDKATMVSVYEVENKKPIILVRLSESKGEFTAAVDNYNSTPIANQTDLWIFAKDEWIKGNAVIYESGRIIYEDQLAFEFDHTEREVLNEP